MTLPNFIVIGARKSGTTSIERYIAEHPQVAMCPVGAPNFFSALDKVTSLETYEALFAGAEGFPAIGERSPSYLRNPDSAERIHQVVPDARLIALLRHPADRAFSDFLMQARGDSSRVETRAVREAFVEDAPFVQESFYYPQLQRYYDRFPAERIRVYRHEDFASDPDRVLEDVFAFLGVDESFKANTAVRYNKGWVPRSRALHGVYKSGALRRALLPIVPRGPRRFVRRAVRRYNARGRPELPASLRAWLTELYAADIERVQELTGLDLSPWQQATPLARPQAATGRPGS